MEDDPLDGTLDFEPEVNEDDDAAGDPAEQDDDEQPDDDDDLGSQINEIMTVTARKLASVIQTRKFGNPPGAKKSIEDRKRTSHCAACGQVGHWKGDPACAASSTKGPNKGQSSDGGKGGKNRPFAKSVHLMSHHYLTDDEEAADDAEPSHASHQVFVASTPGHERHEVYLADATRAAGYVILDTACQRMCAGQLWADTHTTKLKAWGLAPVHLPQPSSTRVV